MLLERFLDPKNDYLFKRLFGTEQNKDILIHFINSVLHLEGDDIVQDVTYLETDQNPEVAYLKQSAVDVLCKDQSGSKFIIEMQISKFPGFEERAQYYAAKAYVNQMKIGDKYEDLKEVIFIAIANYVMFPKKEKSWISNHVTLDKMTNEHDLKAFSFTFIELPKFTKTIDELTTIEDKWLYFFKHAQAKSDEISKEAAQKALITFIGDDVVLKKALDESSRFSMTEKEWNSYEAAKKRALDAEVIEDQRAIDAEQKGKAAGLQQGLEQGKIEGEKAAKIEIARGMIAKKMDINLIAELTGLSEDEINAIK